MATVKKDPQILLYKAIHEVMKEVGYVKKEGVVQFGNTNYKFAGEATMIKTLRPVMVEHGLILVPHKAHHATTSRTGEIINVTYLLIHTEGGTLEVSVCGQGQDKGDKAIPKAMTGAFKYAIRQLFMIETGDDPDRHASGQTAQEIEQAQEVDARHKAVAGEGFKPADINAYMASKRQPKIGEMNPGKFGKLLDNLKTKEGKEKAQAFIDNKNKTSTDRASAAMDG